MCIESKLSQEERTAALAKKPDIIMVWKVLDESGRSEFSTVRSPKLTTSRIHTARCESSNKSSINYTAGFHSFRTRAGARKWGGSVITKFFIRKSWITQIGQCWGRTVYVSKKITSDRSLLEG